MRIMQIQMQTATIRSETAVAGSTSILCAFEPTNYSTVSAIRVMPRKNATEPNAKICLRDGIPTIIFAKFIKNSTKNPRERIVKLS